VFRVRNGKQDLLVELPIKFGKHLIFINKIYSHGTTKI
jgi:hypothetical protein